MNKVDLCKKFVSDPGDDIYQLVETLVEMREKPCKCVYPGAKPCQRVVESPNPFGLCPAHLKTKRGVELSVLWNNTLEELDIQESNEETESVEEEEDDVVEEEDVVEEDEVVVVPPVRKPVKPVAPVVPVRAPPAKTPPKAPPVPKAKTDPKKPRAKKENSEESSVAEGSAKAEYVEHVSEDEEAHPDPRLTFARSKYQNFVNSDGFVLRSSDRTVLGTEGSRGGIIPLTSQQKKTCEELGLNYIA